MTPPPDPTARLRELLQEVWTAHRDPDNPNFNDCLQAECAWCEDTRLAIDALQPTPPPDPTARANWLRTIVCSLAHSNGDHREDTRLEAEAHDCIDALQAAHAQQAEEIARLRAEVEEAAAEAEAEKFRQAALRESLDGCTARVHQLAQKIVQLRAEALRAP